MHRRRSQNLLGRWLTGRRKKGPDGAPIGSSHHEDDDDDDDYDQTETEEGHQDTSHHEEDDEEGDHPYRIDQHHDYYGGAAGAAVPGKRSGTSNSSRPQQDQSRLSRRQLQQQSQSNRSVNDPAAAAAIVAASAPESSSDQPPVSDQQHQPNSNPRSVMKQRSLRSSGGSSARGLEHPPTTTPATSVLGVSGNSDSLSNSVSEGWEHPLGESVSYSPPMSPCRSTASNSAGKRKKRLLGGFHNHHHINNNNASATSTPVTTNATISAVTAAAAGKQISQLRTPTTATPTTTNSSKQRPHQPSPMLAPPLHTNDDDDDEEEAESRIPRQRSTKPSERQPHHAPAHSGIKSNNSSSNSVISSASRSSILSGASKSRLATTDRPDGLSKSATSRTAPSSDRPDNLSKSTSSRPARSVGGNSKGSTEKGEGASKTAGATRPREIELSPSPTSVSNGKPRIAAKPREIDLSPNGAISPAAAPAAARASTPSKGSSSSGMNTSPKKTPLHHHHRKTSGGASTSSSTMSNNPRVVVSPLPKSPVNTNAPARSSSPTPSYTGPGVPDDLLTKGELDAQDEAWLFDNKLASDEAKREPPRDIVLPQALLKHSKAKHKQDRQASENKEKQNHDHHTKKGAETKSQAHEQSRNAEKHQQHLDDDAKLGMSLTSLALTDLMDDQPLHQHDSSEGSPSRRGKPGTGGTVTTTSSTSRGGGTMSGPGDGHDHSTPSELDLTEEGDDREREATQQLGKMATSSPGFGGYASTSRFDEFLDPNNSQRYNALPARFNASTTYLAYPNEPPHLQAPKPMLGNADPFSDQQRRRWEQQQDQRSVDQHLRQAQKELDNAIEREELEREELEREIELENSVRQFGAGGLIPPTISASSVGASLNPRQHAATSNSLLNSSLASMNFDELYDEDCYSSRASVSSRQQAQDKQTAPPPVACPEDLIEVELIEQEKELVRLAMERSIKDRGSGSAFDNNDSFTNSEADDYPPSKGPLYPGSLHDNTGTGILSASAPPALRASQSDQYVGGSGGGGGERRRDNPRSRLLSEDEQFVAMQQEEEMIELAMQRSLADSSSFVGSMAGSMVGSHYNDAASHSTSRWEDTSPMHVSVSTIYIDSNDVVPASPASVRREHPTSVLARDRGSAAGGAGMRNPMDSLLMQMAGDEVDDEDDVLMGADRDGRRGLIPPDHGSSWVPPSPRHQPAPPPPPPGRPPMVRTPSNASVSSGTATTFDGRQRPIYDWERGLMAQTGEDTGFYEEDYDDDYGAANAMWSRQTNAHTRGAGNPRYDGNRRNSTSSSGRHHHHHYHHNHNRHQQPHHHHRGGQHHGGGGGGSGWVPPPPRARAGSGESFASSHGHETTTSASTADGSGALWMPPQHANHHHHHHHPHHHHQPPDYGSGGYGRVMRDPYHQGGAVPLPEPPLQAPGEIWVGGGGGGGSRPPSHGMPPPHVVMESEADRLARVETEMLELAMHRSMQDSAFASAPTQGGLPVPGDFYPS